MRLPASSLLLLVVALATAARAEGEEVFHVTDFQNLDDAGEADRRFYVAGIVGASFATLMVDDPPSVNRSLFTAGGAAGVAISRPLGRLRLEFEGRYRDPLSQTVADDGVSGSIRAANGWSTMANAWRDLDLTDHLGLYAGGGIGAGGYSLTANASVPEFDATFAGASGITSFAWQAGGGVIYSFGSRVTLDLGYRFYALGAGTTPVTATLGGIPFDAPNISSRFSASELLFTIRVYEPFRGWR